MARFLRGLLVLLLVTGPIPAMAENAVDLTAEVQLSEMRPYAQQTVILQLRVSHSSSVSSLDVDPVHATDFTLEPLAGPPRTTRISGFQQMTTDFVYALTPLSAGSLTLPPLQVHATLDSATQAGAAPRAVSVSSQPLSLEVQALPEKAGALLPLYALDVALHYDRRQRLQVGQPFRISIVQNAAGAAGERLGSAMTLLDSPDFKVYPGRSSTSIRLVRNGQLLHGQRIDHLTLVPQRDGQLRLPVVTLPWWDIGSSRVEQSASTAVSLEIWPGPDSLSASESKLRDPGRPAPGPATGSVWLVIIGLVFAFACGWWLRDRSMQNDASRMAGWLLQPMRVWVLSALQGLRAFSRGSSGSGRGRLKPAALVGVAALRRRLHALDRLSARLPKLQARWRETARLRKSIDAAADARVLAQYLQDWGVRVLGLPFQTPLMELGRALVRAYPGVDGERVHRLLTALDASLYGGGQALDLEAWKRDFSGELNRIGARKPYRPARARHAGLPVLNPV